MAEFEEKSNGKEVRKSVHGVSKCRNRWLARVQHPKLKFTIHMGLYDSPEKAALIVKKTKAELQEMCKGDSSTNVKNGLDDFEAMRLPSGVFRRGYRSWSAHIYHPGLKRKISLGSYKSPVEASITLNNKRDEFLKTYGCSPNFRNGCRSDDNLVEVPNLEPTDDLKVRASVSKLRAKVQRDCKFDDEVIEEPNRRQTLVLGSDNLNNISINDESNVGVSIADVPDKPEDAFVQRLPISVFEPANSDSATVDERSMISDGNEQRSGHVSEFDEAMSLGIINEYGQLVGKYSKLDEEMEFSLPGEDVADTGWY